MQRNQSFTKSSKAFQWDYFRLLLNQFSFLKTILIFTFLLLNLSLNAQEIKILSPKNFGNNIEQEATLSLHPLSIPSLPNAEYAFRLNSIQPYLFVDKAGETPNNNPFYFQSARFAISPYYTSLSLYLGSDLYHSKTWTLGLSLHYTNLLWLASNMELQNDNQNREFNTHWNDEYIARHIYSNRNLDYNQSINFSYWLKHNSEHLYQNLQITNMLIDVKSDNIFSYDYRYNIPFKARDRMSRVDLELGYHQNSTYDWFIKGLYMSTRIYNSPLEYITELNSSSGSTATYTIWSLGSRYFTKDQKYFWEYELGLDNKRSLTDAVIRNNLMLKCTWNSTLYMNEYLK